MSISQDEAMKAMIAAGSAAPQSMPGEMVPPIMPHMMPQAPVPPAAPVAEQPIVAPVLPQASVAQIEQPMVMPQMPAAIPEQPMAPVTQVTPEQQFVAPMAPAAPAPVVEQAMVIPQMPVEQPVAPTPPAAPIAVEQPIIGEAVVQNGLDLEYVMTPEAKVQLQTAEVQVDPIKIAGLESIGNCKTSVWAALITILDFIAKELSNNDIIAIDKGTIDTHRNGIFIHCDMQNILGNISLNLTAPDTSVKLLKTIKGGQLVQIFKEEATNSYMFCNIQDNKVQTRVKTTFAADGGEGFGKAPHLGNPVFQKEIPQQEKEIIKTIIAGKAAIGADEPFRFGFSTADNSLVSIGVGKNFTYFFQDSGVAVEEYRCYNPFPVPNMDSCIIRFFKKADDNTTWVQTVSNINPSSIICTEKVELIDSSIEDFDFN